MPPLVGVLHAQARAHCVARLIALHTSAGSFPSDEAIRWAFTSRLLHEVEQLGPGDFDDADEERETIALALDFAAKSMLGYAPPARAGVVAAERARFAAAFAEESAVRAPLVPDVPLRRIATTREVARLSRALEARWPQGSGQHSPRPLAYGALREVLHDRGIATVWLLHPITPALSMIADIRHLGARPSDGAPAWFPPMPAWVLDETMDWFAYVDDGGAPDRVGGFLADEAVLARIAPG